MKIYVAAASAEIERASAFMQFVRELGHDITHDWVPELRAQSVPESQLPVAVRRASAQADLDGVRRADLLVVLVPHEAVPSRGTWVELGYALGLRSVTDLAPRVWCVGPFAMVTVFTELADARYFSDSAALTALGSV